MTTPSERAATARDLLLRANRLLEETKLLGLLQGHFGEAAVTGSVGYDLMVWPDIDIHMPVEESRKGEYAMLGGEIAAQLASAGLRLHRAQFLDDYVDPHPLGAGLYWGLEFRDRDGAAWKCDLWGWEPADFRRRQERDRDLRDALAKADRDLVLRLKTEAARGRTSTVSSSGASTSIASRSPAPATRWTNSSTGCAAALHRRPRRDKARRRRATFIA